MTISHTCSIGDMSVNAGAKEEAVCEVLIIIFAHSDQHVVRRCVVGIQLQKEG